MTQHEQNNAAVVLLSGGLDSATVLAIARERGCACHCLSVDYGQRHRFELAAAAQVAAELGAVEHRVVKVDLRAIGGSALTDDIEVPKGGEGADAGTGVSKKPGQRESIPVTYVPARNLVFLSIAVGYAEVVGARDIFVGVNAVDYSGYPDCRPGFLEAFARAASEGTRAGVEGQGVRVQSPLMALSKAEIIREGVRLGVDYSVTHSCYDPDTKGRACGACESCEIRRRGFAAAGVADPTVYGV